MKKIILIVLILLVGIIGNSNAQEILLVSHYGYYESEEITGSFEIMSYFKITNDSLIYIRVNVEEGGSLAGVGDTTRYRIVNHILINDKIFFSLEGYEFKSADDHELVLRERELVYDKITRTMISENVKGKKLTYKITEEW